jgi:hypothetical protein
MKTRLLLNLVLLCVVAALVLVAVFEPGKQEPARKPLTAFDESRIQSFNLEAHETIKFERRNGHWWIAAPLSAPANDIRVRQLLDIMKAEIDAEYPLNADDLGKYELDKPSATLVFGDRKIVFGGSDPIDMRRYVQIGNVLYLVRDDFSHHLNASATDYVDKKLLPDDARITSITIPGIKVMLGPDGKWAAEPSTGDAAVATALSNAWQSARAIDVKRMDKPGKPGDKVSVGLADSGPIEFVILQRDPELVLGRPDLGLQYEMVGAISKQLLNQSVTETNKAVDDAEDDESASAPDTDDSHDHEGEEAAETIEGEEDDSAE